MPQTYNCEKCDYKCYKLSNWDKHINTRKHTSQPSAHEFECKLCNFNTYNKSHLDRHKTTKKHKLKETGDVQICNEIIQTKESESDDDDKPDSELMTIVKQLLSQNNELKNFIIEQAQEHKKDTVDIITKVIEQTKTSNISNNINTTMTNNSNNKAFNINVFLNEQCKDAINFSDFIKNIEVTREDLENNAQLGFVNGISKILIDNLRELSITERPIHCTDLKRETMYVKDDNKWTKETGPAKLNTAILSLSQKSARTLLDWKKVHPDYKDNDSEFSTRCIVIQRNSMAGYDRDTYYPKVIKAVAREIMVDK
jgi:hypothetical protein